MADEVVPAIDTMDSAQLADSMMSGLVSAQPQKPAEAPAAPTDAPAKTDEAPPAPSSDAPAKAPESGKKAPPAAAPKKDAPQQPVKDTPPKPVVVDDEDKIKDPVELRKRLKTLKGEIATQKQNAEKEMSTLKKQIEDYSKRKYLTPEQEASQEQMVKRHAELEREIHGINYAKSPEFKRDYQDKMDAIWKDAIEEVTGIPVHYTVEEEGRQVEKTRDATAQDLKSVLDAPPAERFKLATKLFGDARELVLGHVRSMAALRSAAAQAIADKQKNYETEIQTRTAAQQKAQQDYQGFLQSHLESSAKARPDMYGDDPSNPEAMQAYERGKKFVEESFTNIEGMDLNTRAARVALIRNLASVAPRLLLERNQARAQITQLEKALEEYRASDPGAGGEGGERPAADIKKELGGSNDLANEFGG
jgi:hypothetical protein